jgi:hypothetical protein
MQRVKNLLLVLGLLANLLLVSACQGQSTAHKATPTSTGSLKPSPTPTLGQCNRVLLPGHLLFNSGTDIHELTCTPTGTIQDQVIVTGIGSNPGDVSGDSITISPDRRFLRYQVVAGSDSTSFQIVSQELQSGIKHSYQISGDYNNECVSWSPGGTQVSFVRQNGLIVENLITGNLRVLVEEPSGFYGSSYYSGKIDCGSWISDDALLFYRFTGTLPQNITLPNTPELDSNTTTLAHLREGTLVDTAGTSGAIQALSDDGAYVLFAVTGSFELVKASDFSLSVVHPISCQDKDCTMIGFVPHSNEVFGYQNDLSGSYLSLVFANPQSLSAQFGPTGLPAFAGDVADLEVIRWGGSPDVIVVYEFKNSSENQDYLAVTSLQSGEVNYLADASIVNPTGLTGSLLGWIP